MGRGLRAVAAVDANMAVSINWGVLSGAVLAVRAQVFGVYLGAPDCWKCPYELWRSGQGRSWESPGLEYHLLGGPW